VYTLAGFDLTTHSYSLLGGSGRRYHNVDHIASAILWTTLAPWTPSLHFFSKKLFVWFANMFFKFSMLLIKSDYISVKRFRVKFVQFYYLEAVLKN
jgi:hypothetical protein